MGLAAVPFGTAQVHWDRTEYRIKVERKENDKGERYIVSFESIFREYHCESEIIVVDWDKNHPPVRISPRFANTVVQVGDMEKRNGCIKDFRNESEVYLFPFQVRRFPLDEDNSIFANCVLAFIPDAVGGCDRVLLYIEVPLESDSYGSKCRKYLNVISDVPVILSANTDSNLKSIYTNNLCPEKKIPFSVIYGLGETFFIHSEEISLIDPINMPCAEQLRNLAIKCSELIVVKDGYLRFFARRTGPVEYHILFDKDLDYFATKDYFDQEIIKNGRVSWKNFSDFEQQRLQKGVLTSRMVYVVLKVHNENDFSIHFPSHCGPCFVEPHGVQSVLRCFIRSNKYSLCLTPCSEQPNDTWIDKVWIECPHGKSPKMGYLIEDDMSVECDFKSHKMVITKFENHEIKERKEYAIKNEI